MTQHTIIESEPPMLRSFSDHYAAIVNLATQTTPITTLQTTRSLGHTLAANAYANISVPPFNNSAMDGFLVHADDCQGTGPWTFPVRGDVPAGAEVATVPSGGALRIMTGAPVPEHAGLAVVPVEHTDIPRGPNPLPNAVTVFTAPKAGDHIRTRGEDTHVGELTAPRGTRIDAATMASLISTGNTEIPVHRPVRVAILATGDELERQIPNSNSPMLAALCETYGAEVEILPASGDNAAEFRAAIDAAHNVDLILTTGGISAGAFDIVKEVLADDVWFGGVAVQPGKPQGAGTINGIPILCLPGNPVSVFVSFHLFALPLMQALSGQTPLPFHQRPQLTAIADCEFRADGKRDRFIPAIVSYNPEPHVRSSHRNGLGSHFVASLAGVNGLVYVEHATENISIGQPVRVLLV